MRNCGKCIDTQLTDNWLREYQLLPQRTHPENHMSLISGFVLSSTVVEESKGHRDIDTKTKNEVEDGNEAPSKRAKE